MVLVGMLKSLPTANKQEFKIKILIGEWMWIDEMNKAKKMTSKLNNLHTLLIFKCVCTKWYFVDWD